MADYKKYDSQDRYSIYNATLAKDPRITEGNNGTMVSLTFVSNSRSDRHTDLWVEANVGDFQTALARYLKKGDVLGVSGKPALRNWDDKEGNERQSFELVRAEIFPPISLFMELKERGFTPGAAPKGGKKNAAKGSTKAPAKGGSKKQIAEIPDDDDSSDESDDSGEE